VGGAKATNAPTNSMADHARLAGLTTPGVQEAAHQDSAVTAASSSPPSPAAAPSSLAEQMASIDAVRAALDAGDARAAIVALDRYERAWPSGLFALEAQVLRVEALVKLGDKPAAQRLAAKILEAQPGTPYARRIRSVAMMDDDGAR
jgi:hypothetical protein